MGKDNKTRIAIAGIGGIGGYIGGKLAHFYAGDTAIEIIFIARGETYKAIHKNGLELISDGMVYTCTPDLVSNDPSEIGAIDVLIICTKAFAVEEVLMRYSSCLSRNTTIITTQNTVNGKEVITPHLPMGATLMEGSIYIASNVVQPGKVQHISGPAKFIFGSDGQHSAAGVAIAVLLNNANIDTIYKPDIQSVLWKKFLFVSPVAIVTALHQITFSEITQSAAFRYLFVNLTTELVQLANAKKIETDENTLVNNINLLDSFKGSVKSSFQLDLGRNKPSEIGSLVKYVIDEARLLQISLPHFENAMVQLIAKYNL